MQKITTFLWFDQQAEEAAEFYTSLFPNSTITQVQRYGEGAPMPAGTAMVVSFTLDGQEFLALNGGPGHPFTDATSLYVSCQDQAEVDDLWGRLTAGGGAEGPCGWLKDRYGLSWQVIPTDLPRLLSDPDPVRAGRAMQAMLAMKKIDVAALQAAAAG